MKAVDNEIDYTLKNKENENIKLEIRLALKNKDYTGN